MSLPPMAKILASVAALSLLAATGLCCATGGANEDDDSPGQQRCGDDGDCESYYRCIEQVCSEPPAMTGQRDEDTPVVEFIDGDETIAEFYLELAVTEQQQRRGLMHRPRMLPEWGMLFVYQRDQPLAFWMKNTYIELDMIFIDSSGEIVGVVERAEPQTETSRSVGQPARYVLEIKGGLAGELGIEPGVEMRLENVDERHQPDR